MIAEFDRFRFVRDRQGALAELPSDRKGERVFLVLDCHRFRLARLHLFEELAGGDDALAARFEAEMRTLQELAHPRMSQILAFGRHDTELYYAETTGDGEVLGAFLRRVGPLPEGVAIDLILQLTDLLQARSPLPASLARFDLGQCLLTSGDEGPTPYQICLSDYGGWHQGLPDRSELVGRVALGLYSLLSGSVLPCAPPTLFDREARPTSEALRGVLQTALKPSPGVAPPGSLEEFAGALREIVARGADPSRERETLPAVNPLFRDWLLGGRDSPEPGPGYRLADPAIPQESRYAFDASSTRRGSAGGIRFQLFPGGGSLPREGWLAQHQAAMRRRGRWLPNQLGIVMTESRERCLLIGEERVEGFSLASFVRNQGPVSPASCREILLKVNAALDAIERSPGSAPVWRLGPRDVIFAAGALAPGAVSDAVDREGPRVWRHLPVKLRLHQTAQDLTEGLPLPDPVWSALRQSGKAAGAGRRAAVLLPLAWKLLTGGQLDWETPLPAVGHLPPGLIPHLEGIRHSLMAAPHRFHSRFVDGLGRVLDDRTNSSAPPLPRGGAADAEAPSQGDGAGSPPGSQAASFTAPAIGDLKPFSRARRLSAASSPVPAPRRLRGALAGRRPDAGALPAPAPPCEPSATAAGGLAPPFAALPDSVPEEPETAALSFFDFLQAGSTAWADPAATPRLPSAGAPDSPADAERAAAEAALEPPSIGRLLIAGRQMEADSATEGAARPPRTASDEELRAPRSGISRGRTLLIQFGKAAALTLGSATLLWSMVYGAVAVANSVKKETPAETLERAVMTDYLKLAMAASTAFPLRDPGEPAATAAGLASIGSADHAILLGQDALRAGRFAESIGCFLRALELTPHSIEARERLWGALERWAATGEAASLPGTLAEELERSAGQAPQAAWLLADHHLPRDPALGRRWLRRSAEGGHARHQRLLGLLLSATPENQVEALHWFRSAAEAGDRDAQVYFGIALLKGRGTPVNPELGVHWLERAAAGGDDRALDLLGVCHLDGLGRPRDPGAARILFRKACDAGNRPAWYNLAFCHARGVGTRPDPAKAASLFRTGADLGDPNCMHALGTCLESGFGVPRDPEAAVRWMRQAASLGQEDALAWCLRQGIPMAMANL